MNSFQRKSGDIEPIDDYFYLVDEQVMQQEDELFEGDNIDQLEYAYLEKKKRRLVSKYTERRYIP
jgi:hypothetical protein